jgi:hypothetical protein
MRRSATLTGAAAASRESNREEPGGVFGFPALIAYPRTRSRRSL